MNNRFNTRSSITHQNGATMIEVLVAILVFSIGLLGIATTQTLGLTTTQSALHRSYAAQLSYELIDVLRMNPEETDLDFDGLNATNSIFSAYDTTVDDYDTVANCLAVGDGCTSNEMAQTGMAQWEDRLDDTLPNSDATLTLNGDIYTLTIIWSDFRNNQTIIDAQGDDLAQRVTDFRI